MKPEDLEEIAERLAPVQKLLHEALVDYRSQRITEQQLAVAIYKYNEQVDAEMPRMARASGHKLEELRERVAPRDDYHAYFEGSASDFLQNSSRGRRLEPPDWAIGQDLRTHSIESRVPPDPLIAGHTQNELNALEFKMREAVHIQENQDFAKSAPFRMEL